MTLKKYKMTSTCVCHSGEEIVVVEGTHTWRAIPTMCFGCWTTIAREIVDISEPDWPHLLRGL